MLTREQILTQNDLPTEQVPVPEWGDGATLTVRRLTASEYLELLPKMKANPSTAYLYLVVYSTMDASGNRLFSEADVEALAGKCMPPINRLFEAADRLTPLTKETPAKNSPATHSDDSSSA